MQNWCCGSNLSGAMTERNTSDQGPVTPFTLRRPLPPENALTAIFHCSDCTYLLTNFSCKNGKVCFLAVAVRVVWLCCWRPLFLWGSKFSPLRGVSLSFCNVFACPITVNQSQWLHKVDKYLLEIDFAWYCNDCTVEDNGTLCFP